MFSLLFSDLLWIYFVGVVESAFLFSPKKLAAQKSLLKTFSCMKLFGFWAKNERAQGKEILVGLTETAFHLSRRPFWKVNHDYRRIPNLEWKKIERFANIFRRSLNLHFTFLEKLWAGELISENNSNFLIKIGFRAEKSLGLSKLLSLCANEYLEEICVSQKNFSEFLWTYRETFWSRSSKLPSKCPKKFWAIKHLWNFPSCI